MISTTAPIREVIDRLGDRAKRSGEGWAAKCPAHDDRTASLSITTGDDGRVLIRCHAGCSTQEIVAKMGLKMADLFPQGSNGNNGTNGNGHRRKLGPIVAVYQYRNSDGDVLCEKTRHEPKEFLWRRPDGNGGYISGRGGIMPPLYNLPAILNAREDDSSQSVFVVEGEKDADRLTAAGILATTSPDGASKDAQRPKWRDEHNETLSGLRVVVVCDADPAGLAHGHNAANRLHDRAAEVRVITALPDGAKDVSDWFDAGATKDRLLELVESTPVWQPTADQRASSLSPEPLGTVWESNPTPREVIIDGLARRGEVTNIISTSKSYKTYLVMNLAICLALGRLWLDRFACIASRVLVIDLELQKQTITERTRQIATAMHAPMEEIAKAIEIASMRGRMGTIEEVERIILSLEPRAYSAIIIDPLYKTYPDRFDENSNSQMTALYRRWERMAEHMDGAIFIVHHGSKGNQSEKRVVDVGSGASAQSRSADCHIALREHEQDGCVVFDARVRSFPPVEPMVLRWDFPLWHRAMDLDPKDLRTGGRQRRSEIAEPKKPKAEPWTVARFASTFITSEAQPKSLIVAKARQAGVPFRDIAGLIELAIDERLSFRWIKPKSNAALLSSIEQPLTEIGGGE